MCVLLIPPNVDGIDPYLIGAHHDGPFTLRATSRIHPGKAEAYAPLAKKICELVGEHEPRVLGFHIYVNKDQTTEVVVQIHPDAESLQYRLELDYLQRATEGIPFTVHNVRWGGFTRLAAAT